MASGGARVDIGEEDGDLVTGDAHLQALFRAFHQGQGRLRGLLQHRHRHMRFDSVDQAAYIQGRLGLGFGHPGIVA